MGGNGYWSTRQKPERPLRSLLNRKQRDRPRPPPQHVPGEKGPGPTGFPLPPSPQGPGGTSQDRTHRGDPADLTLELGAVAGPAEWTLLHRLPTVDGPVGRGADVEGVVHVVAELVGVGGVLLAGGQDLAGLRGGWWTSEAHRLHTTPATSSAGVRSLSDEDAAVLSAERAPAQDTRAEATIPAPGHQAWPLSIPKRLQASRLTLLSQAWQGSACEGRNRPALPKNARGQHSGGTRGGQRGVDVGRLALVGLGALGLRDRHGAVFRCRGAIHSHGHHVGQEAPRPEGPGKGVLLAPLADRPSGVHIRAPVVPHPTCERLSTC